MPLPLPRRFPPDTKGPLLGYVEHMHRVDPALAREIVLAIKHIAGLPEGRLLFALLENATTEGLNPLVSGRALRGRAAQRLLALDLQRMASTESDPLLREDLPGSG